MDNGYNIINQYGLYFVTFTIVDWVDVLTRKRYRDILINSLDFCRKQKGLSVWGYVIMTNHMHCILSSKNGNLSDLIRDFKRYTATHIIKSIMEGHESRRDWMVKRFEFASRKSARNNFHQFWIQDNHPMELCTTKFINQKLDYIHYNPVNAGWVDDPASWIYSSQRNYNSMPAILEIDLMDISPGLKQY